MTTVHNMAKEGFGTGTNELYDRFANLLPLALLVLRSVDAIAKSTSIVPAPCPIPHPQGSEYDWIVECS